MLYGGVSRALAETRPAEAAYVRGLQSRHAGREGPLTAGTEQAVSCARSVQGRGRLARRHDVAV